MAQFKSFISEADLEERKKKRQEEWEKVRKPEDPLERPEEEHDCRSLYDRLKEQKDKVQADYEEAHKLKNMIRGLDDDEVQFLDLVDRTKEELETRRMQEDFYEIRDFQRAVATLAEQKLLEKQKISTELATAPMASAKGVKKSQQELLSGVVKRKSSDAGKSKKLKPNPPDEEEKEVKDKKIETDNKKEKEEKEVTAESCKANNDSSLEEQKEEGKSTAVTSTVQCIGILPGLGEYSDSSDSEDSSSECSDGHSSKYDLLGRPQYRQHHEEH